MKKLKTLLEGFAWERTPGKPLPTMKDVAAKHNVSEGPMNDPALKSLRIKSKGELMPKLSQWWEYDPDDVMRFIYWGKGQMAPSDEKVRAKEWANIVKQLHVKYPIPADAEGMETPPEGFIGENKSTKLKDLLGGK